MITAKELRTKEYSPVLIPDEKYAAMELEKYIDDCLRKTYSEGVATVLNFDNNPSCLSYYNRLKSVRKSIVKGYVFELYKQQDWIITTSLSEDDGPNRPGYSYYKFKSK
jgi:hypothetical protein